eukprot:366030-Chlamydomonas_euryale.AAC.4
MDIYDHDAGAKVKLGHIAACHFCCDNSSHQGAQNAGRHSELCEIDCVGSALNLLSVPLRGRGPGSRRADATSISRGSGANDVPYAHHGREQCQLHDRCDALLPGHGAGACAGHGRGVGVRGVRGCGVRAGAIGAQVCLSSCMHIQLACTVSTGRPTAELYMLFGECGVIRRGRGRAGSRGGGEA